MTLNEFERAKALGAAEERARIIEWLRETAHEVLDSDSRIGLTTTADQLESGAHREAKE